MYTQVNQVKSLVHIFKNGEGCSRVRTVLDTTGNPWFCCLDVANALGYRDPKDAINKWMTSRVPLGTMQLSPEYTAKELQTMFHNAWAQTAMVSEAGMYKFLMQCRAPKAEPFLDWLSHEVLPSVRKTGKYAVAQSEQAVPTLEDIWTIGLRNYKEMVSLAEASGLKDWYTQSQIRRVNPWYGVRKAHHSLNAISEALGLEVKVRAKLTSTDHFQPTNMYHVSVFRTYAMKCGYNLFIPDEATEWQANLMKQNLLVSPQNTIPVA